MVFIINQGWNRKSLVRKQRDKLGGCRPVRIGLAFSEEGIARAHLSHVFD